MQMKVRATIFKPKVSGKVAALLVGDLRQHYPYSYAEAPRGVAEHYELDYYY